MRSACAHDPRRVLAVVFLITGACDGSVPSSTSDGGNRDAGAAVLFADASPPTNNQADLFGATLGAGTPEGLRKPVAVRLDNTQSPFVLGTAYALRSSPSSTILYTIVPVTNASADIRCFVKTTSVRFVDDQGGLVFSEADAVYVTGSVGELLGMNGPLWTDTCVGPRETAYLLDIVIDELSARDLYRPLAGIQISDLVATPSPASRPKAALVPQSYQLTDAGSLAVTLANQGTMAGSLALSFSRYVLFATDGLPVMWSFVSDEISPDLVAAGAIATISETNASFPSASNHIRVFVDFREPPLTLAAPAPGDPLVNDLDAARAFRHRVQQRLAVPLR